MILPTSGKTEAEIPIVLPIQLRFFKQIQSTTNKAAARSVVQWVLKYGFEKCIATASCKYKDGDLNLTWAEVMCQTVPS